MLAAKLKLALLLVLNTHPFSLFLSLYLTEWFPLSFSVTFSPQPIKCGELVVNFSLQHTQHSKQLSLEGSDCELLKFTGTFLILFLNS